MRLSFHLNGRLCGHQGGAAFPFGGRVERTSLREFSDSKIQNFNAIAAKSCWLKPDVIRLEITMHDALMMRIINRRTNLFQDIHDPIERKPRFFGQYVAE